MQAFRRQALPWPQGALWRNRMGQPPHEPQNNQQQDDHAKGDVHDHGIAGRAIMNVRHQPADQILNNQKYNDQSVKDLGGRAVLQLSDHQSAPLDYAQQLPASAQNARRQRRW